MPCRCKRKLFKLGGAPLCGEDFENDFDESDANNRYAFPTSPDRLDITALNVTDDAHYIADSKGSGHFGNFDHLVTINISDADIQATQSWKGCVWGMANEENDLMYFADNTVKDAMFVIVASDSDYHATKYYLVIWACVGVTNYDDSTHDAGIYLDISTTYYLRIKRSGFTFLHGHLYHRR